MKTIIEGFPDRPLTQEEVNQIEEQKAIKHLEGVLGVRVLDLGDRYHIEAGFNPEPGWHFDFYLDLIIETESSVGIAAYPKDEYPPYGEGMEKSLLDVISVPEGNWSWVSKGQKPDYRIETGLEKLVEYRDFTTEQRRAFEALIESDGIQILEQDQ